MPDRQLQIPSRFTVACGRLRGPDDQRSFGHGLRQRGKLSSPDRTDGQPSRPVEEG